MPVAYTSVEMSNVSPQNGNGARQNTQEPRRRRGRVSSKPRLVGLKDAAIELGIAYSSFRKLASNEALTLFKFGGRWYVARADLEAFVERHRDRLES